MLFWIFCIPIAVQVEVEGEGGGRGEEGGEREEGGGGEEGGEREAEGTNGEGEEEERGNDQREEAAPEKLRDDDVLKEPFYWRAFYTVFPMLRRGALLVACILSFTLILWFYNVDSIVIEKSQIAVIRICGGSYACTKFD